ARDGRYDAGAALDAYVHWYTSGPFDVGGTIAAALGAAAEGRTTEERLALVEKHARRDRPANGSLMGVSPLGILGAGRPGPAAAWARRDSRLTHPNPVCQDACAVYVAALATAVGHGATPQACYEAALAEMERSHARATVGDALAKARTA